MLKVEEIFEELNKKKIKYLLVGGLASILYGVPRTTLDIDLAISPERKNIEAVVKALTNLALVPDAHEVNEILGVGGVTFSNDREIDVITDLRGGTFDEIWSRRKIIKYKGVNINVISLKDHINILRRTGRKKDLEDLKILQTVAEE